MSNRKKRINIPSINQTVGAIESLQVEKLIGALRLYFGCYKNSFHVPYDVIPTEKYSPLSGKITTDYLIIFTNYKISYLQLTKELPKEKTPLIIDLGEKMYRWVDNLDWPQTLTISTVGGILTVGVYIGIDSYRNVSIYGWDYFVASVLPVGGGLLGLGVVLCGFVHFLNKLQSTPTDVLKNAHTVGFDNKIVNNVLLENLFENVLENGKTMVFSVKGKEVVEGIKPLNPEETESVMPAQAGIQAIKPRIN